MYNHHVYLHMHNLYVYISCWSGEQRQEGQRRGSREKLRLGPSQGVLALEVLQVTTPPT